MPIIVHHDGEDMRLDEYLHHTDKRFETLKNESRKFRPKKTVEMPMTEPEEELEKRRKIFRERHEKYRGEYLEMRRKIELHGSELAPDEIRIDKTGFAICELTGKKFGVLVINGEFIDIKFSEKRRQLLEMQYRAPCEHIQAKGIWHNKYFYITGSLYKGFHEGIYNLVKLEDDSGFFRIDRKYDSEVSYMRNLLAGYAKC